MRSTDKVALLDHIIVLLPHEELLNPPSWLTEKFAITDGGKHADGKTENKLIVFQDGSYIELISFINDLPEHRSGHWWGTKPYSIIDWCFTTSTDYNLNHSEIVSRLDQAQVESSPKKTGKYSYQSPKLGGRTRPDGIKLEWAVTFPSYDPIDGGSPSRPANLPFFCHDITSRSNRVNGLTSHPCGALGIREVIILADKAVEEEFATYIASVLNSTVDRNNGLKITVGAFNGGLDSNVMFLRPKSEEDLEQVKQHKFVLKELVLCCKDDATEATFSYPS